MTQNGTKHWVGNGQVRFKSQGPSLDKVSILFTEQKVPAVVIPSLILDDAQQAEWSPKSPQAARNLRQVLIHLLGC